MYCKYNCNFENFWLAAEVASYANLSKLYGPGGQRREEEGKLNSVRILV